MPTARRARRLSQVHSAAQPPRYDPDGDIVEPTDEYEDEDDLESVEENPYTDIRLERMRAWTIGAGSA